MVGAPRAKMGTGAVYKFFLHSKECEPFIFDFSGNTTNDEQKIKVHQWLGAATDGNGLEEDRFVVR